MDIKEIDVTKLSKTDLQTLTLECLVEMKERTGLDIKTIGEDAVKCKHIEKVINHLKEHRVENNGNRI